MMKLKIGDIVQVIGNSNDNNYSKERIYAIHKSRNNSGFILKDIETGIQGNVCDIKDLKIYGITKEFLIKRRKKTLDYLKDLDIFIEYIEKNKIKEIKSSDMEAIKCCLSLELDLTKKNIDKIKLVINEESLLKMNPGIFTLW